MDSDSSYHSTRTHSHNAVAGQKTRACANCARLKMKCQWSGSGSARPEQSCIRCSRMKLQCHVPEPTQRRKRGRSTRVAQLEEKLDNIVSLLATSNHPQAAKITSPLTPTSPEASQRPVQQEEHYEPCISESFPPGTVENRAVFELNANISVTREQATLYLNTYRKDFVPNFPFVALPSRLTPQELYVKSRVLFWAIMGAVAPMSGDTQHEVKSWFRRYMAEHMVVQQEKELGMLQAILVHLAWNDFHSYVDLQATNLIQLATALVFDLRLDKTPGYLGTTPRSLLGDAWNDMAKGNVSKVLRNEHSLEEKRAVLGLYHATNLLSVLFRRGSQLPWNNHLAQCCESLLQTREFDTDLILNAIVKIQSMAERIYNIVPTLDQQDTSTSVYRMPLDMAINGARKELETFAEIQPQTVKNQNIFWVQYHILIMRLYEPIISMRAAPISDPTALSAEPFQRTAALWKCLEAAAAFFEAHLAVPAAVFPTLPFTSTGLIAFAVVTCSRLLLLDGSTDWDPVLARRRLDFAEVLVRMSARFDEADVAAKSSGMRRRVSDDGTGIYVLYSYKLRWIRQWYLARIPGEGQQQQPAEANDGTPNVETATDPMLSQWTDFQFDESFWQQLFAFDPTYQDAFMGHTTQSETAPGMTDTPSFQRFCDGRAFRDN